jgi:alpha-galactosidase
VQDFVYDSVSNVLESADISYLKWDCNRMMSDFPNVPSSFFHDYMLGLYSVLQRLSDRFADVLFENCASGGNRFDLGMLSYFPQSWLSDDTDSFQRFFVQSGAALGYPLSVFSNHVAAKTSNQMLRYTSLDSKFDIAAFGVLGYELDLHDLTPLEKNIIKTRSPITRIIVIFSNLALSAKCKVSTKAMRRFGRASSRMRPSSAATRNCRRPRRKKAIWKGWVSKATPSIIIVSRPESIALKKFGHLINMASPIHLKEDGVLVTILGKTAT